MPTRTPYLVSPCEAVRDELDLELGGGEMYDILHLVAIFFEPNPPQISERSSECRHLGGKGGESRGRALRVYTLRKSTVVGIATCGYVCVRLQSRVRKLPQFPDLLAWSPDSANRVKPRINSGGCSEINKQAWGRKRRKDTPRSSILLS